MLLSLISLSLAQESTEEVVLSTETEYKRPYLMESNVRVRNLFLPDSILDTWFYDSDTLGAYPEDRPDIQAYTVGLEYVFNKDSNNWIIWAEYMGSGLEEGYWDDVETGETVDHDDGDWVRPDNFEAWWTGFNYAKDFAITPKSNSVWLSMQTGAGLGLGFVSGELTYWTAGSVASSDCETASPAYVRRNSCEPDGVKDEVPRILPMIDVSLSARVNFADRAHIRFDGGLHNLFYYGVALGGIF